MVNVTVVTFGVTASPSAFDTNAAFAVTTHATGVAAPATGSPFANATDFVFVVASMICEACAVMQRRRPLE